MLCNRSEKPLQREAHALQLECSPRLPQLEKARVQQRRPTRSQNKYLNEAY